MKKRAFSPLEKDIGELSNQKMRVTVRKNSLTGFTLVEIILSTAIFAILILSIYSAFRTGLSSFAKIDSSFNKYSLVRIILNKIEGDLSNTFPYLKSDSCFKGTKSEIDFFNLTDASDGSGVIFPKLGRVIYKFQAGELKRLFLDGLSAVKLDNSLEQGKLIAKIEDINFEYASPLDADPNKAFEWLENWPKDDTLKKEMPLAVKVKLKVLILEKRMVSASQSGEVIEISKIIPINLKN